MWKRAVCLSCVLLAYSSAYAQFSSDFEGLNGSAAGEVLTGQDGYYIPGGTNSIDQFCFTYAGNALGIPANPCGGNLFVAGTGPGDGVFARAQKDIRWPFNTSIIGYDILVTFTGTLPASQNVGSFSIEPFPGSTSMIALPRWTSTNAPLTWAADYVRFDAAGAQILDVVPVPGFSGLPIDTWFRWETSVNFASNRITEIVLTEIETGGAVSYEPTDWYLEGGSGGGRPSPTGFRFTTRGVTHGNTIAWDNLSIEHVRGGCTCDPCDMNCNGDINTVDIEFFIDLLFNGTDPCCGNRGDIGSSGDVNLDGMINAEDIEGFIACLFP